MRCSFSWLFLCLPLVGLSACSTTPRQIYSRSNLKPGYAYIAELGTNAQTFVAPLLPSHLTPVNAQ